MRYLWCGLNVVIVWMMAGPALALSCLATDVATTFTELDQAEESYVVVHGTLTFNEDGLPQTNWDNQLDTPQSTILPARLSGRSLTKEGFTAAFDHSIDFDVQCAGPWCASAVSGSDVLAFVEYRAEGYVLSLGPCYGNGFFDPSEVDLNSAVSCMKGGACLPVR